MSGSAPRVPGGAMTGNTQRGAPKSDNVSLIINGKTWSGWTAVRVGRGIERFPSDFEFALTERYPGEAGELMAEPGSSCVLKIGSDVVITGAIDRYVPAITAAAHEVRIHGRSLCRALVDCSAGIGTDLTIVTQVASGTILSIAQQMAKPFGITVSTTAPDAQKMAPQFNVNMGETASDILDRVTRWGGLLYYDDTAGNLVLAQVGTTQMASGFKQGVNVEAASATFSADQRFSDYIVFLMSLSGLTVNQLGLPDASNGNVRRVVHDGSKPQLSFRPHAIISEQVDQDTDFANLRATWEMNRRNGRSRAITLTTDTWRDSAGTLWQPNALVMVDMPVLKITNQQWCIGEVTYRRDESGTHADLTLMPPQAYQPEPFNLQPVAWQADRALKEGAARKIDPTNPGIGSAVTSPNAGAGGNPRAGDGAGV